MSENRRSVVHDCLSDSRLFFRKIRICGEEKNHGIDVGKIPTSRKPVSNDGPGDSKGAR